MLRSHRRAVRTLLFLVTAASAAVLGTASSAGATELEPEILPGGNPSCADLGYANEVKFEPVGSAGSDDGVSYTTEVVEGVFTVEWTSTTPIDAVITKQADGAAVFHHDPAATSGTAWVATGNDRGAISHLTFCLADAFICPGDDDPMTDVNGDGVIDEADCDYEPPFICPGDDDPMTDVNGDGVIDEADCDYEPPFVCPGETDPATDVNDDGMIDLEDCRSVLPRVETPEEPAAPVEPEIEVEVDTETPEVVPVAVTPVAETPAEVPAPVAETPAVLGSQVERGSLARTGSDGTATLALTGLALVLLGAGLRRMGTRVATAA